MKYRRLTQEELHQLETDFIRFLAAHSIPAEHWEQLKKKSPEQVEHLIEKFSDVVFEKALKNAVYLELKTKQDYRTFHCLANKVIIRGIMVESSSDINFTIKQNPQEMIQAIQNAKAKLKVYSAQRIYKKERKLEVFELIKMGALISKDGAMFKTLESLEAD